MSHAAMASLLDVRALRLERIVISWVDQMTAELGDGAVVTSTTLHCTSAWFVCTIWWTLRAHESRHGRLPFWRVRAEDAVIKER